VRIATLLDAKGTAVATIGPDAAIRDAVRELAEHGIGALVVSSDGKAIVGILSERDIVRGLHASGMGLLEQRVSDLMSATVTTCEPTDTTDSLMETMTEKRIRHVPVVDGGVLAGIVSIGDVVKTRIGELEKDRKELVDYINAR
jgi:CBS domain-containing protein